MHILLGAPAAHVTRHTPAARIPVDLLEFSGNLSEVAESRSLVDTTVTVVPQVEQISS